jgi:hypothetical protein
MSENEKPKVDEIDNIFAAAQEEPETEAAAADPAKPGFEIKADASDIDLYDDSEERKLIREEEEKSMVTAPEPPARETIPLRNATVTIDAVKELNEEVERRFGGLFDLNNQVTVTETERDAFVRAALFDAEMLFKVEIPGIGITYDVAIPPEAFTVSAAAAARHWGRIGFNDKESEMQWLLSFQQMHAWFQIRSVNGEPTPWSVDFCDGLPKLSDLRKTMNDPDNFDVFHRMNATRWKTMVEAMRVAEYKYKLCLEAWHDRSFFTSADTA